MLKTKTKKRFLNYITYSIANRLYDSKDDKKSFLNVALLSIEFLNNYNISVKNKINSKKYYDDVVYHLECIYDKKIQSIIKKYQKIVKQNINIKTADI